MSDNMNEQYQKYYNQVLTGTLTDTVLKSVSYQANIKLANDIIENQEKTIKELQTVTEDRIKQLQETNNKLQTDLYEMNKLKSEYEGVKHQVQHLNTYRNEVVKANETIKRLEIEHANVVKSYEEKIQALTNKQNLLETPTEVQKKVVKPKQKPVIAKAKIIKQDLPGLIVKDGGSF